MNIAANGAPKIYKKGIKEMLRHGRLQTWMGM
jgi:hypothetical protein